MHEPDVSALLTVAQAIEIIDAATVSPREAPVTLAEADGLVLARDIVADRDYPPFDRSLMDGYAVRAADVSSAETTLRCIGEIAAGAEAPRAIKPGETYAIMTGAPLPAGADAVVPVEQRVARGDDGSVRLAGPAASNRYIARRGSESRAGDVVLHRGTRLGPAQLAAAATVGASTVACFARPRVAVLATGDELVTFDRHPTGSRIRNSNSIMLIALLRRLGSDVVDLGMVRDDPALIRDEIGRGMTSDVLFVTGGMSMGEHDYVPNILLDLGVILKITKLRIKPGKPFLFGLAPGAGGRFVFGLPGNPVSGFVCTLRLCARLLARMSGTWPRESSARGVLETPLPANGPREFYQPARIDAGRVRPLEWKGSADVFTLSAANCLLVRAEHAPEQPAGSTVEVLELPL